ncbi:MAG: acyltransferase family protein [Thermomonas sp.]|uniref:acyltransferase family protein n=1 Tax=Thermomonas sp. TaxID=1971895 RepID=UPI00262D4DDD|nr:acyltransferase family protein [Thermomonas sp.]MCC7097463.1 acyltransferase family protein [Thermomonas sp.]
MEEVRAVSASAQAGGSTPRHIVGLDGLRGIAIAAVLLFHADLYWARGGYLGVDLFFVISGFLITGLLANECEANGRVNLTQFYWRRGKRLLPAVWLLMAGITLLAWQLAPDALPRLRRDALASFFYVTNWELVFSQVAYFESVGRQPLLQHLWSLSIEEQYYIGWALLVALCLPRLKRSGLALLALLLAAASAAWMAALAAKIGYPGNADPSRLYFGTDTHGFPLLLGSALGLLWRPERLSLRLRVLARGGYWTVGLAALAAFVALCALLGEERPSLYPWGFLLSAAASLGLILVAVHPGVGFGRLLDNPPMRWLGQRSYGIYLWHWPIYMLTRPELDLPGWGPLPILALRLLLTALVAELSYRYLEQPIRQGSLERLWRRVRGTSVTVSEPPPVGRAAGTLLRGAQWSAALLTLCLMPVAGWILWRAPSHTAPAADVQLAMHLGPPKPGAAAARPPLPVAPVASPVVEAVDTTPSYQGKDLTAVGDSVLLGTSPLLQLSLRGTDVHATMGWQAADVIRQLQALRKDDTLRPVVLLHLGTNGYVYEGQLREILTLLADRERVILVDSSVPRRWMRANNALIEQLAPEFPNVVVYRWSEVSNDQPDYFVSDGVHLTDRGQRTYIAGIMRTGHLVPDTPASETAADDTPELPAGITAGDLSPTLVMLERPPVDDRYWRKLARCETDDNWQTKGTRAGGLAIAQADWQRWGGTVFAVSPDLATPEQQIAVADRISTQGWTPPNGTRIPPIGFARWRCAATLRPPRPTNGDAASMTYTRDSVLAQQFHLGERGEVVRDLQTILGLKSDGIYSKTTRDKHRSYLELHGLPLVNAAE